MKPVVQSRAGMASEGPVHDVFVSYANADKPVADRVVHALEAQQIRCWYAPRDVPAGSNYGAAIVAAIKRCRVLVLVHSSQAGASKFVHREVERAVTLDKVIIPLRIDEMPPTEELEFFLGTPHWLDFSHPPLEQHLPTLVAQVGAVVAASRSREGEAPDDSRALGGAKPPASPEKPRRWEVVGGHLRTRLGVVTATLLVGAAGATLAYFRLKDAADDRTVGFSDGLVVESEKPTAVTIDPPGFVLPTRGKTQQLTARVVSQTGDSLRVVQVPVRWRSSDPSVVTVTESGGLVTATSATGAAKITATVTNAPHVSQSVDVTVGPSGPSVGEVSAAVNPNSVTLTPGQSETLTVAVRDANGNRVAGMPVRWSSSRPNVASVTTRGGVVTAVAAGTATVTAVAGSVSATAEVAVAAPPRTPVASVVLSPSNVSLQPAESRSVTLTTRSASGATLTGRQVRWESDNEDVVGVTVDSTGRPTLVARAVGTTVVRAMVEGHVGLIAVTVHRPGPTAVTVTPPNLQMRIGERSQLNVTVVDERGIALTDAVTWTSSSNRIVTVVGDARGATVTANAPGQARVTAAAGGRTGTSTATVTQPPLRVTAVSVFAIAIQNAGMAQPSVPCPARVTFAYYITVDGVGPVSYRLLLDGQPSGQPDTTVFQQSGRRLIRMVRTLGRPAARLNPQARLQVLEPAGSQSEVRNFRLNCR
jgi:uncharacterized protein YjdB